GKEVLTAVVGPLNFDQAFGELEGSLNRIVETTPIFAPDNESVDDDRDVVIHSPIELGRVGDLDQLTVDDRADEALLARGIEQLAEFSLSAAHERRQDLDPGSFRPLQNGIG